MIDLADVQAAAQRIAGHAHRTPLLESRGINELVGLQVLFKCENLQRGGAFKFRGAYNTICSIPEKERAGGVFAYSSGNHAQAVALAAQLLGIPSTILMPHDAPASKLAATLGYGAEVVHYDRYTQDRAAIADELATERGLPLVKPYDDERIMAGAGTVALEVFEEVGSTDTFLVPLGGGGLLSGCATALRAVSPSTRIVGVEPDDGNDWQQSLAKGERTRIAVPRTIADGLQLDFPGEVTWPVIRDRVDEVVTVSDADIIVAMRLLFERMKLVVEPSGAVGLAALMTGAVQDPGDRAVVVLSGGNVGADRFAALLA